MTTTQGETVVIIKLGDRAPTEFSGSHHIACVDALRFIHNCQPCRVEAMTIVRRLIHSNGEEA